MLYIVDQQDVMVTLAGDPDRHRKTTPLFRLHLRHASGERGASANALRGKRDLAKAKELVKESGYNGERIVLLSATDQPIVNAQANVVAAGSFARSASMSTCRRWIGEP